MKKVIKYERYTSLNLGTRIGIELIGLLVALLLLLQPVHAQNQKSINIKLADVTLESALEMLKQQADVDLIFNHEAISKAPKITIDINTSSVDLALKALLKNSGFTYKVINETFVISPKEIEQSEISQPPVIKQTLRGQIIDKDAKSPMPFATVQLLGTNPLKGSTSDIDGNFRIDDIPVGRYTVKVSFVGYKDAYVSELLIGSGKESIITVELSELLTSLNEVVVTAGNDDMFNEMVVVSGKSFDAQETKRYAASISDPARMAQVFAGVSGTDDASNEIVIRGNSPNWLLWKLEGVEIPSPNHFAEEGYSSGAVSILSSNMLGRSDFYTGAFSADYGNALSGVFDLRLRNGNNQEYEHTFQAGVLGIDIASEGPFKKGYRGSYLFNYRYSTLSLLNDLNIEVSENALPNYQDLSFKVNLPTEKLGNFAIWGLGGLSDVSEKYLPDSTDSHFEDGYTDFTKTGMYASGITHTYFPDKDSYFETVISNSKSYSSEDLRVVDSLGVLKGEFFDKLQKESWRLTSYYNRKFSSRLSMRYGVILSRLNYDYNTEQADEQTGKMNTVINSDGYTMLYQGYAMAKYKFSDKLVGTAGAHYTYFRLNKDQIVEPRFGLSYELPANQKITFGYGRHSRHENLPIYFVENVAPDGSIYMPNKGLELTHSSHFVLGYEKKIGSDLMLKSEVYYQFMDNLPVSDNPNSLWTPIFGGFALDDTLVNEGKGRNYGLELTLQKYFSNQYYFMITSSIFDSKYQPKNGKWYNTVYNINYVNNLVGGKEWKLKNDRLLGVNGKVMWSGGKRQLPIDLETSREKGETVYVENDPWSFKTQDYLRLDVGIKYHIFKANKEHVFSLDIQNVTNRLNTWSQIYDAENDQIIDYPMAGLIPILTYRLEF